MRKKLRSRNRPKLKLLIAAFVGLLEVILTSSLWHKTQAEHLQWILIVVLTAIFIWMLLLSFSHP